LQFAINRSWVQILLGAKLRNNLALLHFSVQAYI